MVSFLKRFHYNQNQILWAVETSSGLVRKDNEDYYIARPSLGLWVLCDGLGGHAKGALASRVCAEAVVKGVLNGKALKEAVQYAHEAVKKMESERSSVSGNPGTTVAALHISGRKWEVAWVGDTRVWLYERGKIQQVTRDHSVVRQLLDWGAITEEEAKVHPDRHMLNKVVGIGGENLKVGINSGRWNSKQVFMLGTDGMAHRDEPEILSEILSAFRNPNQVVAKLKTDSLEKGGFDNFTIAVVGRSFENRFIEDAVKKSRELFYIQAEMEAMSPPSVP
jgi:protein phosphatase